MRRGTIFGFITVSAIALASTDAVAADRLCREHKPDPDIDFKAKDLALKLLDGQTSFMTDFNEYRAALRKVKRDNNEADKAEAELLIDLYCKDPQDVTLNISDDGRIHGYQVDTWRIVVNETIIAVGGLPDLTAVRAEGRKHTQTVAKADFDVFIADFNRDAVKYGVKWRAKKDDAEGIDFIEVKQ